MQFKKEFNFEQRKQEADRVISKYPDRIPIICEKSQKSKAKALDKKKYLVPCDLTIGQFVFIIRRRLALPSEKAIFLFVGNIIPPTHSTVKDIYGKHKSKDGFLYIQYSEENVFGWGIHPPYPLFHVGNSPHSNVGERSEPNIIHLGRELHGIYSS